MGGHDSISFIDADCALLVFFAPCTPGKKKNNNTSEDRTQPGIVRKLDCMPKRSLSSRQAWDRQRCRPIAPY